MIKVIYICAPFTARTAWEIECNVRRAEDAALQVALAGAMPLCPHTNTRYFHQQCTADFWYRGTLELMFRCDAVMTVGAHWNSAGCRNEIASAKEMGMPVLSGVCEMMEWVAK